MLQERIKEEKALLSTMKGMIQTITDKYGVTEPIILTSNALPASTRDRTVGTGGRIMTYYNTEKGSKFYRLELDLEPYVSSRERDGRLVPGRKLNLKNMKDQDKAFFQDTLHEIGHIVKDTAWQKLSPEARDALYNEWEGIISRIIDGTMTVKELMDWSGGGLWRRS